MIRRLLLPPYLIAEPWLRHSNWMVRRVAQVAVVGIAIIWLALPGARRPEPGVGERYDELARRLWASPRLMEFLNGPALPRLGVAARRTCENARAIVGGRTQFSLAPRRGA